MKYSKERQLDILHTNNVNHFLDFLYKKYNVPFERITDVERQKKGIDVLLFDNKVKVDEKVALKYYKKNLDTYSLEISTNNNKDGIGWMDRNAGYETESILFCWIKAPEDNEHFTVITSLDCALVSKEKIWEAIEKDTGFNNVEDIKRKLREDGYFPKNYKTGKTNYEKRNVFLDDAKRYKVVQSLALDEEPINILIPKEKLKELAGPENCFELPASKYVYRDGKVIDEREEKTENLPIEKIKLPKPPEKYAGRDER